MEPIIDGQLWLVLLAVSFIAGYIDAVAGGGGMLTVPALLTSGLPPHIALGTNKLAASFGSFTASVTFYRQRLFDPIFWRHAIVFTAIGACIGTLVIDSLDTAILDKIIPVVISISAIYMLFSKTAIDSEHGLPTNDRKNKIKQAVQGFTLGAYDGFAGPGTGAFWTATSTAIYRMNLLLSAGLARSTNFISNFVSLLTFIYLGHVNFL